MRFGGSSQSTFQRCIAGGSVATVAVCDSCFAMERSRSLRTSTLGRRNDFTGRTALGAAHLEKRLRSQSVSPDSVDRLNRVAGYTDDCIFVTHTYNKNEFHEGPLHDPADIDVVVTENPSVIALYRAENG